MCRRWTTSFHVFTISTPGLPGCRLWILHSSLVSLPNDIGFDNVNGELDDSTHLSALQLWRRMGDGHCKWSQKALCSDLMEAMASKSIAQHYVIFVWSQKFSIENILSYWVCSINRKIWWIYNPLNKIMHFLNTLCI